MVFRFAQIDIDSRRGHKSLIQAKSEGTIAHYNLMLASQTGASEALRQRFCDRSYLGRARVSEFLRLSLVLPYVMQ